jgi:hypothetical protein
MQMGSCQQNVLAKPEKPIMKSVTDNHLPHACSFTYKTSWRWQQVQAAAYGIHQETPYFAYFVWESNT